MTIHRTARTGLMRLDMIIAKSQVAVASQNGLSSTNSGPDSGHHAPLKVLQQQSRVNQQEQCGEHNQPQRTLHP